MGVLLFLYMLPRGKTQPTHMLEYLVALVLAPFLCTEKALPGLVWAIVAITRLRLANPAGESNTSHTGLLYFPLAMQVTTYAQV